MKRVCKYVYDIGDQACSKLCDPNGGQLKECMRNCPAYFMDHHNRIMPDPRPCPCFQYYVDGTESCEPCEELCNSIASPEDCKLSCPEFFKYYTCLKKAGVREAGVREDTCSCDDVILALSILTFLLFVCLLVAGYVIIKKRLRCRQGERHKGEASHDQGSDVELTSDPTATSEYSSSGATDTNSLSFTNFKETEQTVPAEHVKSELVSEMGSLHSVRDTESLRKDDTQSTTLGDFPSVGNQQTRALEDTTTIKSGGTVSSESHLASNSEDSETRPKESFLEPSPGPSTVSPFLDDTPPTNQPSCPPVSLDERVTTYHGISRDGSACGTSGPSTIHENWNRPISPNDFRYLMHQEWVRVQMVNWNRTEIEIMVNGIGLEDARRQISENTNLESSQYDLTTFVNCFPELLNGHEALDIANLIFFKPTQSLQPKDGPMVSTIGGYLEHRDTGSIYLITSAHNSSKGTEYFCDRRMRPEDFIGKCKYWFYDDKLDIAFIQLEDNSSTKRLPRNILSLPSDKPGVTIDYKPWLVDDPFSDRGRTRSRDLLKFSRKVDRGELCEIIKRDSCHLAMKSPPGEGSPGDSGSLVTSCHVKLSQQGKYLPAVGLASRKETLIRKTEDRYLVTEACIFTPIWPAVKKIAQIEGVHSTKFRFFEPGSRKWPGIQPVMKDTGYQSSPPKL